MAVSETARRNHDELFPDHVSTLAVTDPELIEYFDNFAFDEVLRYGSLDTRMRLMVQLAALIGCQALSEYRVMLGAALTVGVTPVEAKEIVYQAVPYRTGRHQRDRARNEGTHSMTTRTWLITGVSSGFGHELTTQLLDRGDRVVGTVRRLDSVTELTDKYPDTFHPELLDVTDTQAIRDVVDRSVERLGRIDVIVSNAGYGLFGAAEELSDAQIDHIIATNLVGSIQLIRAALPHLRAQGGGRIIQLSSYGGQVSLPGNSMYHATKWGIEGFVESVAQEVAPFGIGITLVEPGGARTEFRYGSARVADLSPVYDDTPAHSFLGMLDPANGLAPGDPARMAGAIIASVDQEPAPLRMILGSQALESTLTVLRQRIAGFEAQTALAASTDFPPGD